MNEVIQQSEPTAARRRMYFRLISSSDNVSGKSVTTTGVKAQLSTNGATGVASTNDIVQIDATNLLGEYYVELTTGECGTEGTIVLNSQPTGCLAGRGQATVVTYDPYAAGTTLAGIAQAVWQDTTGGDFTVAGSIGKSLFTNGNAPGAASGLPLVGSNMGTVTSVTGSVGSIAGITFPTNFSSLSITGAGGVTANIASINGTTVTGNGTSTPWGPLT